MNIKADPVHRHAPHTVGIVCVLVIFRPTITKMRWLTWWRKCSNYTIEPIRGYRILVRSGRNSAMRNRMRAACEHFIDVARDPDDVIAARIRADELDILIDLKGYTMGARPSVSPAGRAQSKSTGWVIRAPWARNSSII